MKLVGRGDDGDPLGLTEKQALILQSDQLAGRSTRAKAKVTPVAQAFGDGFKASSSVKFYLLDNSTYLGDLTTDAAGAFAGAIPVPAGIKPGAFTLQLNGYAPDNAVRSLSIGVIVKPTTVAVRTAKASTKVYFAALSPTLDAKAKTQLKGLVKKTGNAAVRIQTIGYVQPSGGAANDQSLSTARAKECGRVPANTRCEGLLRRARRRQGPTERCTGPTRQRDGDLHQIATPDHFAGPLIPPSSAPTSVRRDGWGGMRHMTPQGGAPTRPVGAPPHVNAALQCPCEDRRPSRVKDAGWPCD